ncbi:YbaB/EbfC family nucleoid-associated protein [Nocardia sp. NPDC056000]|uniref:YbaB/EbfC family nucleoid-associated protein n=1 Tax=Nocardia sp. NPDC056000 TaxID=3345674 RepID=UPI0035DD5318
MEEPGMEDLTSANAELKRMVNSLLDGLDDQAAAIPEVVARLSTSQSSAWSADQLVEVTVDAYGVVVNTRLAENALRSGTPERLARSITEAARAAAQVAEKQRAQIIAPIADAAHGLPDLSDLFPGAPSLQEIRGIVGAAATPETIRREPDSTSSDPR